MRGSWGSLMTGLSPELMDSQRARARWRTVCAGVLLLLGLGGWPDLAGAVQEYGTITTRLIKIITIDDSARPIGYPSRIVFDRAYQETYVLSSNGRITIYDKEFFPLGSVGVGRGVENVTGMAIGPAGKMYLCRNIYGQGKAQQSVVSIYNNALLLEREILLGKIPELAGFMAYALAIATDGTLYVAGYTGAASPLHKGVAVLDNEGGFKRWLAPRGKVLRGRPPPSTSSATGSVDGDGGGGGLAMMDATVAINDVQIDVNGRLYLLSTELSEIYVYDSQGKFHHKFGTKGGAKSKLSTPRSLAVDYPRRLIYVADYMRHTILAYDYERGHFVYEFGGKGMTPLWYLHPESLAVDSRGRVIIADLFNRRVQVVDPTNPERPVIEEIIPELEAAPIVATQVVEPEPPAQLLGLAIPVQLAATGPILRVPARGVRLMEARSSKKIVLITPSQPLLMADGGAPVLPGAIPPPALPVITAEPDSEGASPLGSLARSVRSVAGVYGPVAALLEVGAWMLRKE